MNKDQLRTIAAAFVVLQGIAATPESLRALDVLSEEALTQFVVDMAQEVLEEEKRAVSLGPTQ